MQSEKRKRNMAVSENKARKITRTLREAAKDHKFKDRGLTEIIKEAANPYQMLQAINFSGRLDHTGTLIMSKVFLHVDAIAKLSNKNNAGDKVEALVAAFKCLLNNMKARETSTGSLFVENEKADAEWVMVEDTDSNEYVMIEEDISA